jgi:hypothetical protein
MYTITDLSGYPAKHWYFVITKILSYRYTENIEICYVLLEWSVHNIRITIYKLPQQSLHDADGLKKVIKKCIKIPTFYTTKLTRGFSYIFSSKKQYKFVYKRNSFDFISIANSCNLKKLSVRFGFYYLTDIAQTLVYTNVTIKVSVITIGILDK